MESWWQLGESSGSYGRTLNIYSITCPFCLEKGNFKTAFHAEKRKPNESKILNFDTLECANCRGYVMVLWSADSTHMLEGIHDYRILPWPLQFVKFPEYWPEQVGRFWLQAKRNLIDENWDAAVVMARSSLQAALRENKAEGRSLYEEINDLANKGILPPIMKDFATNIRLLANESAHPQAEQSPADPLDARDIIQFLDFLLEYLYALPHRIGKYRERKNITKNNSSK
ncbi:MAG TPA: DUF4145 domain-containing protein [bacterium]|nr:DUF4145 domain-containing protein [bacterium]